MHFKCNPFGSVHRTRIDCCQCNSHGLIIQIIYIQCVCVCVSNIDSVCNSGEVLCWIYARIGSVHKNDKRHEIINECVIFALKVEKITKQKATQITQITHAHNEIELTGGNSKKFKINEPSYDVVFMTFIFIRTWFLCWNQPAKVWFQTNRFAVKFSFSVRDDHPNNYGICI